ncbi:uncharacterized protein LOC101847506 [Aplysia californica]|uniref:Uncharacterized protein LOC101847506 n=1 Tax=Aplysia californica TaxID=6500 RepID=A0ABM0JUX7_APLCA|nr:uncharacterized protein LOC101847506 [Aplysia californica]
MTHTRGKIKKNVFQKLADTIDIVPDEEELIIMGDFNGHVGPRRTPWENYLGPHGDTSSDCNYNGEQLLALCAEYELYITNTFYQHRPSQPHSWYRRNNLEISSQIDFILRRIAHRTKTTDARSIPNITFDTDHRPVMMMSKEKKRPMRKQKIYSEKINLRKLNEEGNVQKVEDEITKRLENRDTSSMNVEET